MPAGFSGSYGLNNTALSLQPSTAQWEDKSSVGIQGDGRPMYPAITEFTLSWELMPTSDFKQINDFYLLCSNTGSVVAELPKFGDVDYLFYAYSGTFVNRPSVGAYFIDHVTNVKLLISNIRVT